MLNAKDAKPVPAKEESLFKFKFVYRLWIVFGWSLGRNCSGTGDVRHTYEGIAANIIAVALASSPKS